MIPAGRDLALIPAAGLVAMGRCLLVDLSTRRRNGTTDPDWRLSHLSLAASLSCAGTGVESNSRRMGKEPKA